MIREQSEQITCCLCGTRKDIWEEMLWLGGVPVCKEHEGNDDAVLLEAAPERARQMILWRQGALMTADEAEHLRRLLARQWLPQEYDWGPIFAKIQWQAEIDQERNSRLTGEPQAPPAEIPSSAVPPAELD